MNLILTYLIDLPRTHKFCLLFLICSYPDLYKAHLRFKRHARWTLLHRSLTLEVSIGSIPVFYCKSYLITSSFIFSLNIIFYLYFLFFLLVLFSDFKNCYKFKTNFEMLIHQIYNYYDC